MDTHFDFAILDRRLAPSPRSFASLRASLPRLARRSPQVMTIDDTTLTGCGLQVHGDGIIGGSFDTGLSWIKADGSLCQTSSVNRGTNRSAGSGDRDRGRGRAFDSQEDVLRWGSVCGRSCWGYDSGARGPNRLKLLALFVTFR